MKAWLIKNIISAIEKINLSIKISRMRNLHLQETGIFSDFKEYSGLTILPITVDNDFIKKFFYARLWFFFFQNKKPDDVYTKSSRGLQGAKQKFLNQIL